MTETWAAVGWPCESRTGHVTSRRWCRSSFLSSVSNETPHHAPLICSSHQTSPRGGYLRCADFVPFFSMTNINRWCWLSTGREINRWRGRIATGFFSCITRTWDRNNIECHFSARRLSARLIWQLCCVWRRRSAGSFPHWVQQAGTCPAPFPRPWALLTAAHRGVTDRLSAHSPPLRTQQGGTI